MSLRSEIEKTLGQFASTKNPPIPVALENKKFVKPSSGYYLEVFFLDSIPVNSEISATGIRTTGKFQINCYGPLGVGMGAIENLSQQVVNLYPVVPKIGTVSIEKPLSAGQGIVVENFMCIPVTGNYRVEQ